MFADGYEGLGTVGSANPDLAVRHLFGLGFFFFGEFVEMMVLSTWVSGMTCRGSLFGPFQRCWIMSLGG